MRFEWKLTHAALWSCTFVSQAAAQETVAQPAEAAKQRADEGRGKAAAESSYPGSWAAPPSYDVVVVGKRELREEERIGEYKQPRWSAIRRFPTTRIYVMPEGAAVFEWWWEGKFDVEHPARVRHRSQVELALGIGHRMQMDFYLTTEQDGVSAPIRLESEKVELRYALADWGVIPLNPTIYVELVRQHDGYPKGELKLLLGDEIAPRWHAGANLVLERELGGVYEHEYAVTAAVAYTVIDEQLSLGLEVKGELVDERGSRFSPRSYELLGGPSLQWRPVPAAHIDAVFLFGAEIEDPGGESESVTLFEPTFVFGWEF